MNVIAVEDKIVVQLKSKESKTSSGIIIPETANSLTPQNTGVVISAGPDVKDIKKGDSIIFHERAGMDVMLNDIVYKVIAIGEVYAIIEEAK